jgi:iron complex transport system substrate-binding protein
MRVVSLLASGTEIVCALGARDTLVGRSHECDNPAWVRRLPVCTRPAFDVSCSSRDIDADVRRRVKANEPLYYVDADLINRLKPDVVITQVHCDVCAVTPQDVARAGCPVVTSQVVSLSAASVAGIYDDVRTVADALHRQAAAAQLIARMQERIDAVRAIVRGRTPPTIVLLEWTDPVFVSANWSPELIEAAGGRPLLAEKGHSTAIPWERVVQADPDYVLVAPCGFDLQRTIGEIPVLEGLPEWSSLTAAKKGQIVLADGNRYFNRSGTTIVETVEILAEILHGDRFERRWQGEAWQVYRTQPAHQEGVGLPLQER